ncbi:MAG: phosphatase PAP2 family protein [Clostridium butyricum]|nr:phosphatase PAP2 family protein [Clostridium butyricum]
MKEKHFIYITNFFRQSKISTFFIKILSKFLPVIIAIIYLVSILYLAKHKNDQIILFTLVPAINFICITLFRNYKNAPRPYDIYNFTPLTKFKRGKGRSFPSRHTSSAFIIAMACLYINIYLGILTFVLAFLIGISRIASGVHFPKDVIVGMLSSILLGYICFFI